MTFLTFLNSQRIKSNKMYTIASKFWRCTFGDSSESAESQNENNLTLETKIADEKNQTTGITTIECINDTKFYSIRKARQLKDAHSALHTNKRGMNEKLDEIVESIAQQANELQEFLSTVAKSKHSGKVSENAAQKFIQQHQLFLSDAVEKLREIAMNEMTENGVPHASTPYRSTMNTSIVRRTLASPMRSSSEYRISFEIIPQLQNHCFPSFQYEVRRSINRFWKTTNPIYRLVIWVRGSINAHISAIHPIVKHLSSHRRLIQRWIQWTIPLTRKCTISKNCWPKFAKSWKVWLTTSLSLSPQNNLLHLGF